MTFKEILEQIVKWLEQDGRVSYRAVKRQFELDDAYLEDLKDAICYAYPVKDDGQGMIWVGTDKDAGKPTPADRLSASTTSTTAERRQLTVMFCDLAGSTALSQELDPEDLREVIRSYQETATEAIAKYDGYIAQYLGDGLLLYFGWPRAHEDDPKRAVYSGLEIIKRIQSDLNIRLNTQYGVQLSVRIGIHTGPVVVGQMGTAGRHENLAMGDTVNVASRLEGLADSNTIVISSTTERLLHNAFAMADMGRHKLKGVAESINLFRVIGAQDVHLAEELSATRNMPFLVGRDEETGLLLRRWNQSKEGLGQVVFIGGAAGIGKSVLVKTIRIHVRNEDFSDLTFRCASYHQNSAFYSIISRLEKRLGFEHDDSIEDKRVKLEQYFKGTPRSYEDFVRPIGSLLSILLDPDAQEQEFTSQKLKQDTLDALIGWLVWEAQRSPLLVIWEDLHWADPSTLELIELVLEQIPTVSMLSVLTYRPEFEIPWPTRSHITSLTLNGLERPQTEAYIAHLAQNRSLPDEVVEHIITKTDGVPLFVEELTKMLLDSGLLSEEESKFVLVGSLSDLAIPDTLQDSLMARLDRLNAAKEIAQLGAVLGREFEYKLLQAISPQDEEKLRASLIKLVDAELLYRRGRFPRSTYIFKHALIQDAAYASLLKSKRQKIHRLIAQTLESEFTDIRKNQPELIAQHYTEAGDREKACAFWHEAGLFARQRSAHAEAIAHFKLGLKVLETFSDSDDHSLTELNMRVGLAPSLVALKGGASKEVGELLIHARDLSTQLDLTAHLFPILWGLTSYYLVGADHFSAREIGEELVVLAESSKDPVHHTLARFCVGMAEHCLANFGTASGHMRTGISYYRPEHHREHITRYGIDLGVFTQSFVTQSIWFTGLPSQALQMSTKALSLAQELDHPFSLSMACGYAAMYHQIRGDVEQTYKLAIETVEVSDEHQFVYYGAWGKILRAWALAMQGNGNQSEEDIRAGMHILDETGTRRSKPYFLGILAEVVSLQGNVEGGLELLTKALMEGDRLKEPWWISELHRLKGEMYLQLGDRLDLAERCFEKALDVARAQDAKPLELRTAISMAKLWQQQAKVDEAHTLLQQSYGLFSEGFDTPDLLQAQEVLEALQKM